MRLAIIYKKNQILLEVHAEDFKAKLFDLSAQVGVEKAFQMIEDELKAKTVRL